MALVRANNCSFGVKIGMGLDIIMTLILAAFPIPPKDLSGGGSCCTDPRAYPKQLHVARPYHLSTQSFEALVSWELLD